MTRPTKLVETEIPVTLMQRLIGARAAVRRCRQPNPPIGLARAGEYIAALEKAQDADTTAHLARCLIASIVFSRQYARSQMPWYIAAWRAFPNDELCAFYLAALCQAGVCDEPETAIAVYANLLQSQWMDSPRWDEFGLTKRTILSDLALLYAQDTADVSPDRILIVDATFRRALATAPERAALAAYLAVAYRADELTDEDAEEVYACHFEAQPDDSENTRFLANFLLRTGRFDDFACSVFARRTVDAEREGDPAEATRWTIALTHAYIRAGRLGDGMLTTFREAQRLAPDDRRIGAALSHIAAQQEPEQCDPDLWATLETALSCEREYAPIFAEYGWDWNAIVRSLAEGWGHGNRTDRAARGVYARAAALFPHDTQFLVYQAQALATVRNYDEQTLPIYRSAHALDPEQEEIALALSRAYISAGAHLSEEEQQAATLADVSTGIVRRVAVAARENRGEEDDGDETAIFALSGTTESSGETEEEPAVSVPILAQAAADSIDAGNPAADGDESAEDAEVRKARERVEGRTALRREALHLWELLFRRGRIWPELLRAITTAYTHEERVGDIGMKVLERHAAFDADDTVPLIRLGREWRARGDREIALKLFEQAVARKEDDFEALFETGLLRMEHLSDISGGAELLRRAMALPVGAQHLRAHLALGEALLEQNRREEARALFQKILDEIDPEHAPTLRYLARLEREMNPPPTVPPVTSRPYGRRATDPVNVPQSSLSAQWAVPYSAITSANGSDAETTTATATAGANGYAARPAGGGNGTAASADARDGQHPFTGENRRQVDDDAPAPLWPTPPVRAVPLPSPISSRAPFPRAASWTEPATDDAIQITESIIVAPEPPPAAPRASTRRKTSPSGTTAKRPKKLPSAAAAVTELRSPTVLAAHETVAPPTREYAPFVPAVAPPPPVWDTSGPATAPPTAATPLPRSGAFPYKDDGARQDPDAEIAALQAHIARQGPDSLRCRQLADIYIGQGDYVRAESTLRQIIALGQADKRLYTLLGDVMLRARSNTQA